MFDVKGAIEYSIATKKKVVEFCLNEIQSSVELMIRAVKDNKSIFWCGNGGSAADSQHMAAELPSCSKVNSRIRPDTPKIHPEINRCSIDAR